MRRTGAPVKEFLARCPMSSGAPTWRHHARDHRRTVDDMGTSIIGFGAYHYRYLGGCEGDSGTGKLLSPQPAPGHLPSRRVRDPAPVCTGAAGPAQGREGLPAHPAPRPGGLGRAARADRSFSSAPQGRRPGFPLARSPESLRQGSRNGPGRPRQ